MNSERKRRLCYSV